MAVIISDRLLAVRHRAQSEDGHGDRVPAGFGPPSEALPGLAQEQPDTPLGTPGDRTWLLDLDPGLWPVYQQDMVLDPGSGQRWNVTSAQLRTNARMPLLNHVHVEARLFTSGSGS